MAIYVGIDHVLCVNSATSGLMLSLHWLGIGKGDEVIVPAYTYCATALAVLHVGATPVMVDVKDDFNIDPEKVKEAITTKTKAIIPVDFAGWPCDYDALFEVVNDAASKKHISTKRNCSKYNWAELPLLPMLPIRLAQNIKESEPVAWPILLCFLFMR